MDARTRLAALLAVSGAAVAIAVPVASAGPTPDCPVGYVKNLATGCAPWWQIGHGTPLPQLTAVSLLPRWYVPVWWVSAG
jgi:hypothetical protein